MTDKDRESDLPKWEKDPEWDDDPDRYVAKLPNGYEVQVGDHFRVFAPDGTATLLVSVQMPHQCDEWQIAYGYIHDLDKVRAGIDEHVANVLKLRALLDTMPIEEIKSVLLKESNE